MFSFLISISLRYIVNRENIFTFMCSKYFIWWVCEMYVRPKRVLNMLNFRALFFWRNFRLANSSDDVKIYSREKFLTSGILRAIITWASIIGMSYQEKVAYFCLEAWSITYHSLYGVTYLMFPNIFKHKIELSRISISPDSFHYLSRPFTVFCTKKQISTI